MEYFAHETAVDLEEIHREMLQIPERGQTGAEIIERKLATQFLEGLDKTIGLRKTRNCCGLGDLETDLAGINAAVLKLIDDKRQKLIVAEALARKVY